MKNVDAVIIWDANARHFKKHGSTIIIPEEQNSISTIPIVILKSSKNPEQAKSFIDFIMSARGREIIKSKGYTVK